MIRYITLAIISLWMTACAAHDSYYYSLHPKLLQQALQACPAKQPSNISCDELKNIALHINESAYQLRLDPQGYGKKILLLQQTIAQQESALQEKSNQPDLQSSLKENKRNLQERLAIVKWLESPEG